MIFCPPSPSPGVTLFVAVSSFNVTLPFGSSSFVAHLHPCKSSGSVVNPCAHVPSHLSSGHGCLLRGGRAARQPDVARPAGDCREPAHPAGRGLRRQL